MMLFNRANSANVTKLPKPIVWQPSGQWDGNDGKWSSFFINIGGENNGGGQNFRVLISTSTSIITVPGQAEWCDKSCAAERGVGVFDSRQPLGLEIDPAIFKEQGQVGVPIPHWWADEFKNRPDATLGTTNVFLGPDPRVNTGLGGAFVCRSSSGDLFMGSFGLGVEGVKLGSHTVIGFIRSLHLEDLIPSSSFGYTAGTSYRPEAKGTLGNLVIGGYDRSRLNDAGVSIGMLDGNNNTLVVGVQSIVYRPDPEVEAREKSFTGARNTFYAAIDSTLPYLWLPDAVCAEFEEAFQLAYDEQANLYTISDDAHEHNLGKDATVSFQVGDSKSNSAEQTSIYLPYSAFALQADRPLVNNSIRYFPIKKARRGKYVLGRTFLQEAYLIVDYERRNFTVAQVKRTETSPPADVVAILSKDFVLPTPIPLPAKSNDGLAPGAIAGIVVGTLALLGFLAVGAFFWWKKRRSRKRESERLSGIDTTQAGEQVNRMYLSELDSEPPGSPRRSGAGGYYDREKKDIVPYPPINEMESPPAELYSPPPESLTGLSSGTAGSERTDYFIAGNKVRRRGATRESSGNNTPGETGLVHVAELPGDDGRFMVGGQHFEPAMSPTRSASHSRGPSDNSLNTNIDEVIANAHTDGQKISHESQKRELSPGVSPESPARRAREGSPGVSPEPQLERRPSHARGLSDTTVQSESTAISEPTPEEVEAWAANRDEPRRPLSE